MKKILLLIVAAMVSFGANAGKLTKGSTISADKLRGHKIENAPKFDVKSINASELVDGKRFVPKHKAEGAGTSSYANLCGVFNTMFGLMQAEGLVGYIEYSEDKSTVWVNNFFPLSGLDAWVEGTISGNQVTFKRQVVGQLMSEDGPINLYFNPITISEDGESYSLDLTPLTMTIGEDGSIYMPDYRADNLSSVKYIALTAGTILAPELYDYSLNVEFKAFDAELVEVPETATTNEYLYNYTTNGGFQNIKLGEVANDGNDYYFNYMTPDAGKAWVKGTRNGDKVEIPGGQFVGTDGIYWMYFTPTVITGIDEDYGTYITETRDKFVLNYDGTTFTSADEDILAGEGLMDGEIYDFGENYEIAPFTGLERDVPTDPYALQLADYSEDYGQYFFGFGLDNIGINNKYLAPENISVRIYLDDEAYTFTPDEYYISEEMNTIPWGFMDEEDGYDLAFYDNGQVELWLWIGMFEKVGAQVVYNLNGEELVSNIVYIDEEGEESIVECATGVTSIKANDNTFTSFYDLQGRKINSPIKGKIYIKNGKKILK